MPDRLSLDQLKVLGHPLRLAVLRCLMNQPATLSQLGERFRETPAHIRHHLKILDAAGFIEPARDQPRRSHLEKYYRAASGALLVNLAVLPQVPEGQTALVLTSKDAAARRLAETLSLRRAGLALHLIPLNSLEGLMTLRQGICQMATCHLLDPETGEYNRPFIRRLFPGQPMTIVRLYFREEGLLVQPGNPLGIAHLEDLARPDVTFINRELGAGIRLWLDRSLKQLGIPPAGIRGYASEVSSHTEVAQAVRAGKAGVGLGIAASARQAGVDFIPLFEEPYELVLPYEQYVDRRYAPFFELLNSSDFRTSIRQLDGYTVSTTAGQAEVIP